MNISTLFIATAISILAALGSIEGLVKCYQCAFDHDDEDFRDKDCIANPPSSVYLKNCAPILGPLINGCSNLTSVYPNGSIKSVFRNCVGIRNTALECQTEIEDDGGGNSTTCTWAGTPSEDVDESDTAINLAKDTGPSSSLLGLSLSVLVGFGGILKDGYFDGIHLA